MKLSVGFVLYAVAVIITGLVIADKYFGYSFAPLTPWVMRDATASLLLALALALLSRWL